MNVVDLCEQGRLPDWLTRAGIRQRLSKQLHAGYSGGEEARERRLQTLLQQLREDPIAVATEQANEQHYEVTPDFYRYSLGYRLKYSSGYWPDGVNTLDASEDAMFELYAERAQLQDGQKILDLGCGWGSLTLWLAEKYPNAQITSLSNAANQRAYIESQAAERGYGNIQVYTADINVAELSGGFDRIISIEMFEHMRNYQLLLKKVADWLAPQGMLFVHIFAHRELAYLFESDGDNWMGRHFFTGGIMPSKDLLLNFQDDLLLQERWWVSGCHYERTCNAWLEKTDQHRERIQALFEQDHDPQSAAVWLQRWRMFFMACAELFGYQQGEQWGVAHYRFIRR